MLRIWISLIYAKGNRFRLAYADQRSSCREVPVSVEKHGLWTDDQSKLSKEVIGRIKSDGIKLVRVGMGRSTWGFTRENLDG